MSKTSWILLALAAVTVFGLTRLRLVGEPESAEELLRSARDRLAAPSADQEDLTRSLRELTLALGRAGDPGDDDVLRAEILMERAAVFRARGDHGLALSDCQTVLAASPEDLAALRLAAQSALGNGRPEEAAALARRLAALAPESADAPLLLADTHEALAELALAPADAILDEHQADAIAAEAALALRRLAALAPDDTGGAALLDEACEGLPESRRTEVEAAVEAAAVHVRAALSGHLQHLDERLDGKSVAGIQKIFRRAGEHDLAIDLGAFAFALNGIPKPTAVLAQTALALEAAGRDDEVSAFVAGAIERLQTAYAILGLDDLALYEWCGVLDRLGRWRDLDAAARALNRRRQGVHALRDLSGTQRYFQGRARLGREDPQYARSLLRSVPQRRLESFPQLSFKAAYAAADASRALGEPTAERHDLKRALRFLPESRDPTVVRAAGDVLRRMAIIERAEGNLTRAEAYMTRSLTLLPDDRDALEPLWEEIGREATERSGKATDVDGRPVLSAPSGPHSTWVRAAELLVREPEKAAFLSSGLLGTYPGLPGALEVLAEATRESNPRRSAAARLELVERGFAPRSSLASLRRLPLDRLDGRTLVRWILLDPTGVGPVVVARALAGDGASLHHLVLRGAVLDGPTVDELAPALSAAGAEAMLVRVLLALPESEPISGTTGALAVRAALRPETSPEIAPKASEVLPRVIERVRGAADRALVPAADLLLAEGRPELALRLLDAAAEAAPETRLRRAAAALLLGDGERALTELERAEPFFDGPDAALGRVCLAADLGDSAKIVAAARELVRGSMPTGESPSPPALDRLRAVMLALSGDVEGGRTQLEGRPEKVPPLLSRAALWLFGKLAPLDLSTERGPDADLAEEAEERRALVRLLLLAAAEVRPWAAWTLAHLDETEGGAVEAEWVPFLRARAYETLGDLDRADAALRPLTTGPDASSTAWLWRERLATLGHGPGSLAFLRLQAERLASVGALGMSNEELLPARVRADLDAGRYAEARTRLEEALRARRSDPALLAALLPLLDVPGDRARGVEQLTAWLATASPETIRPHVPVILSFLTTARDAGELGPERWRELVRDLAGALPRDPAPVRALATESGALDLLERFRRTTRHVPIEELRAGEAARWGALLRGPAPEQAVRFLHSELEARPGSPGLWLAYAEALVGAGHRQEARDAFAAIQAVHRAPALQESYVRHAAALGAPPARVLAIVNELGKRGPLSPEMRFARGAARASRGGDAAAAGLAEMLAVWEARGGDAHPGPRAGRRLALALFEAGRAEDALSVLTAAIPEATGHDAVLLEAAEALVRRAARRGS